jgi:hypothetical protein
MNSANAWSIELGRSLSVSALLIAAHSIAVGALVVSVEPLVAAVAGCAIAVSAARSLRLHGWRSASAAVVRLSIGEDGSVQLTARDAANESGALDLRSTVYPGVVVVRL